MKENDKQIHRKPAASDVETLRLQQLFGEALGDLPSEQETEAAWKRFSSRMERKRHRSLRIWSFVSAAAAVVVLLWLLPWKRLFKAEDGTELFASVDSPSRVTASEKDETIVFATPSATTASVALSDGTKVLLNANSRLEYPKVFPVSGRREVYLRGEARFEVAKDRRRPFIVTAGSMRTQVLGTVFDVNAYTATKTSVTLFRGKVRVSDTERQVKRDIVPGQKAILDGRNLSVVKADLALADSWTSGDFSFDEVPLGEVVQTIGTWYNVSVLFKSSELLEMRVHFLFPRRASLQTVVSALNDLGVAKFSCTHGRLEVSPL